MVAVSRARRQGLCAAQAALAKSKNESARGKAGQQLREALHAVIRSGQVVLPYDSTAKTDTVDGLKVLDADPTSTNNVILLYASRSETKTNYPAVWNREHMWPESYGTGDGPAHSLARGLN